RNFLGRHWPKADMAAVLAIQNDAGRKRVLPLILNSKDDILTRYPFIEGLSYREFGRGPSAIAEELATLIHERVEPEAHISVIIESIPTGRRFTLDVPVRATVGYLIQKAQLVLEAKTELSVGPHTTFKIRLVLVDVSAEGFWRTVDPYTQAHC